MYVPSLAHRAAPRHTALGERTAPVIRPADLGPDGRARVTAGRVALVGTGGVVAPAAFALASAGLGELVVFGDEPPGGAARAAGASGTAVRVVRDPLTADTAAVLFDGVDVVLSGADTGMDAATTAAACEACRLPLVWGSVREFSGVVTVFWTAPPEPATPVRLADLYPAGSDDPSTADAGEFTPLRVQVGSLLAAEALKLITGIGSPLVGRVALIDALATTWREIPLRPKRPEAAVRVRSAQRHGSAVPEVDDLDSDGRGVIIDVREADEVAAGMLPGAVHIRLKDLMADVPGVIRARGLQDRHVIVVCKVGARARVATRALRAQGVDAEVLAGGMVGWNRRQQEAA